MHSVETTVEAAARLLAHRFGGAPELTDPSDLGGSGASLVVRCRVSPNPFLQERTIVIKQLPDDTGAASELVDGITADQLALVREIVAYQYTNTLSSNDRPGPVLLAYDIEERLLILSDVGDGTNFTDVLTLFDADSRRTAVRKLGRSLGRMHAGTHAGSTAYDTLLRRQCARHHLDPDLIRDADINIGEVIQSGLDLLERNGIEVPATVHDFAQQAKARHVRTEWHAFTPFDVMPDNILLTNHVVFLDYEWASFRDIVFDVACVIAGFPQDNSTPALSDEETLEFLTSWRAEVAGVWPTWNDTDELGRAVMSSLVGWALMSLVMLHLGRDVLQEHAKAADPATLQRDRSSQRARLTHMTQEQLQDLATTVDAIKRFSGTFLRRHPDSALGEAFDEVRDFAHTLLRRIADLGGHPLVRHD